MQNIKAVISRKSPLSHSISSLTPILPPIPLSCPIPKTLDFTTAEISVIWALTIFNDSALAILCGQDLKRFLILLSVQSCCPSQCKSDVASMIFKLSFVFKLHTCGRNVHWKKPRGSHIIVKAQVWDKKVCSSLLNGTLRSSHWT